MALAEPLKVKAPTVVESVSPPAKALRGKVAVITGSSRGIGAAIARELGSQGSHVVLNYLRTADQASELAQELDDAGQSGAVLTVQADVSDEQQAGRLMQTVWEHFGRLDILVNNAGITRDRTFRKISGDEWRDVIETDLNGVFYSTYSAMPYLIEHEGGRVINVGSVIGLSGNIGQTNYAASKAGVIGFTKSLALEWARHKITVNCVAPGFIETDMLSKVPDNIREQLFQRIPLHRFGTPEEVAQVVRFLCVEGDYITVQVISINGGLYM
jgi:acetoacetyl-CoA reductase